MSGRKGLGVKADDLINQLQSGALKEVEKRNPELPDEEKKAGSPRDCCSGVAVFSAEVHTQLRNRFRLSGGTFV
jgi:arginyl-tRNA synthetase